ncbi:MAG: aminotransferase class III-fold pyridoxal phosphate-dependent enzyme [Deltaproteobacteria bacterium]|nr:aminotransferase class III-fold pyridoxal phosphate-dependent enzyme [Deltaproteobacteria bacterium]
MFKTSAVRSKYMEPQEMIDLCKKHSLFTWTASGKVEPVPIARAEGIYLYTSDGTKILDFNSLLMSVNIGHSHPKVVAAIKEAADGLLFSFPTSATESRAKLSKLLADLLPGDLNTLFFTTAGADANENAIRAARVYTGRQKILSRYRSYHGATNLCMQLTGDPRRWPNEPGGPGFVKVMDPWPYNYSFGDDEETITKNNLVYLEEVIQMEGPQTIAAMIIETITGTNGVLRPPKGYLKGLRALLDKYDILLICDEVMAGFGRSGKMFGFMHDEIIPDMVTMAKGLTSSYVPLGALALRDKVADYFRENVFPGGLTYNSHSFCCAVGYACVSALVDDGMVENSAAMGKIMREEMDRLALKHPSMKIGRNIGLFGMIDLQKNSAGEPMAPFNSTSTAMTELAQFFKDNNFFTFVRWHSFMCNPPLCIKEKELRTGFEIIDRALDVTDKYFEG